MFSSTEQGIDGTNARIGVGREGRFEGEKKGDKEISGLIDEYFSYCCSAVLNCKCESGALIKLYA